MLTDQISKDYIEAMKAKDSAKSGALNFLRAQIKQIMVDERLEKVEDAQVISIIKKQVKQRQDSITQFKDGGRDDLAEKEQSELDIYKTYLPEEMSTEAVAVIVDEVIAAMGASSMKDMGNVMKEVLVKTAGQADGKVVSGLVKEKLASL